MEWQVEGDNDAGANTLFHSDELTPTRPALHPPSAARSSSPPAPPSSIVRASGTGVRLGRPLSVWRLARGLEPFRGGPDIAKRLSISGQTRRATRRECDTSRPQP